VSPPPETLPLVRTALRSWHYRANWTDFLPGFSLSPMRAMLGSLADVGSEATRRLSYE
jgi:hypothetical protein